MFNELIELIRGALQGRRYLPTDEAFRVERSLPAGHVQAALATARRPDLARPSRGYWTARPAASVSAAWR